MARTLWLLTLAPLLLGLPGRALAEDVERAWAKRPWPKEAREYRLHLVAHAHLDPVWLWPWSEGVAIVLSTFRSMLDLMKQDPTLTVTAGASQHYQWVAEQDPAMLAEIRRRVKEGRWELVGGWWVEADGNMPSGEAMARQGLYGQRTLQRLFGRTARVGFAPDTFGHAVTLPQILKLQGLESYIFWRPDRPLRKLPRDLFSWQSPDGTRLPAYRIPHEYGVWKPSMEGRLKLLVGEYPDPSRRILALFGLGDHGGGPNASQLRSIKELARQAGAPRLQMSTPSRFLEELRRSGPRELTVIKDELNPVFAGCYTSESSIKKGNRLVESALVTAEKLALLASVSTGLAYPGEELEAAWRRVLFLQFHDSLPGTALSDHYRSAREGHGLALQVASEVLYRAAQRIAWQIPTSDPKSEYLVVFNPHAWIARLDAEYELDWPRTQPDGRKPPAHESLLEDERGTAVPHQWVYPSTASGARNRLAFRVEVPPMGWRQLRLRHAPVRPAAGARADEKGLENALLRATLRPDGSLAVIDKRSGRSLFAEGKGVRALVVEDRSSTWGHEARRYDKVLGAFRRTAVRVIEDGPFRARLRVRYGYGASALAIDWMLRAGSPELEALITLDWHEQQKMLKLAFPVDVKSGRATYEIPYGHLERPVDGQEVVGQRWVDLSGTREGKPYGLALVNDAKYGYSAQDSELRLTVVRGAPYAHHTPKVIEKGGQYAWQDQGRQTLRLLLIPHQGSWQEAGLARRAEEMLAPVPVVYQGIHPGKRAPAAALLEVEPPSVVVAALKQAEDSKDVIVRLVETAGQPVEAVLKLPLLGGRTWRGKLRGSEIKTLRIPRGGGPAREVNLLERAP